MKKLDIKKGDRYGTITLLEESDEVISPTGRANRVFLGQCDCGKRKEFRLSDLRSGKIVSCGCYNRMIHSRKKHNFVGTKIYNTWSGMKDRCNNKNSHAYKNYGGRGISYEKKWDKFEGFLDDMYTSLLDAKDKNLSLDRIDNNGNYCKKNCRWATTKEQARNKRCTLKTFYQGRSITLIELSELLEIKYIFIYRNFKKGLTIKQIIENA